MIDFPTSFGAIPNPVSFGVGFFSDLQLTIAACLGVAAVAYVVLLAVALRRNAREQVATRPEAMEPALESRIVTRLLEELEVYGTTAGELYLILLATLGVARALAALTVFFSAGHGPGL